MENAAQRMMRETLLIAGLREVAEHHAKEEDQAQTREALTTFAKALRQRVRLEEEFLYPALEGLVRDPHLAATARLRRQHAVMLELLGEIARAINHQEWRAVHGDLRELKATLDAHAREERHVLAPVLDQVERGCA
jgi:hypothetical protein